VQSGCEPPGRHCGTGIGPDRDITGSWRDVDESCASLPAVLPARPAHTAATAGFSIQEGKIPRETDCLLEGTGFEPSVPREAPGILVISVLVRADFSACRESSK
jgi:hypothetical protein